MILSKDTTTGRGSRAVTTKGERSKAIARFNNDAEVPAALRPKLLNAAVSLDYNNNQGIGSGVILNAEAGGNVAYVLTAKHLLYVWADQNPPVSKPAEIATADFLSGVKIYYGPPALGAAAPTAAAVSAVDFTGSSDQTWDNDLMVLKVDDADFHAFVAANRFVPAAPDTSYQILLKRQSNGTHNILDNANFIYLQMGYGSGRDKDIAATAGYEELKGKLQCRWPSLKARAPAEAAFAVDNKKGVVTSTYNNICLLTADVTNSTGEGDSGGPLFAIPYRAVDRTKFYLVGVTTGANIFTEDRYRDDPKSAPGDDTMDNNVVTFWDTVFAAWDWN